MIEVYRGNQLSDWIKPEDKERLDKQRGFDSPNNSSNSEIEKHIKLVVAERRNQLYQTTAIAPALLMPV